MKKFLHYLSRYGFALIMLAIGVLDLAQPEFLINSMQDIGMPSYLLTILGVFKILGSLALLLKVHWRLKEWAFAGFFIWALGAISSHLLSGHGISDTVPVLLLLFLLLLSFYSYLKVKV